MGRAGVTNDAGAAVARSGVSGAARATIGGAASGCCEAAETKPDAGRARGFSGELVKPGFGALGASSGDLKALGRTLALSWPIVGDEKVGSADEDEEAREKSAGLGVPGELKELSRTRKAGRSGEARRGRLEAVLKRFSGPAWDSVTTAALLAPGSSAHIASIFSLAFASATLEGAIHPLLDAFMNPTGAS
jgi:hypothetical protein